MINAFLKLPINFKDICKIYPPSINDILTTQDYGSFNTLFTISQEDLEDEFLKNENNRPLILDDLNKAEERKKEVKIPTPFDFLIIQAAKSEEGYDLVRRAFEFFTKEKVSIVLRLRQIWFGDMKEIILKAKTIEDIEKVPKITENNYFDFQNVIRQSLGQKEIEAPNPDEDPRIKRIKAKARYRDKIKAKSGQGLNLEKSLEVICCMNMGLNPLNIGQLSLASIGQLVERYQQKEKYEIDIRALIGGADSKKVKPQYWIK